MKVALDTNILAYAEGVNDDWRRDTATATILAIGSANCVLPTQVAGELYTVLLRKGGWTRFEAAKAVRVWSDALVTHHHSARAFADALELAAAKSLQIWDALILSAAAEAGCLLLLSEDMQDGFVYRGMTIANPFAATLHPLLASLLDTLPGAAR